MTLGLAVLAVAAGAVAQAVTGLGFALVCTPFLAALLGPVDGVRTSLLLSCVLNTAMLARTGRAALPREAALIAVPGVLVTPLVAWAIHDADTDLLAVLTGVATLVAAGTLAAGVRVERARGRVGAIGAGLVSGATNAVAGIGGPPVALYAVNAGWPANRARPTMQTVFLVTSAAALLSRGFAPFRPALLAGLAAGWLVGLGLAHRVDERIALRLTLAVAGLGGLVALLTSL